MIVLSLFAYMETKKQKDTAPKTLLGYLPRLLGMSKTRWGLNMKIHLF